MTTDYRTIDQAHHINKELIPRFYKGFNSLGHLSDYLHDTDTQFWDHARHSITGTRDFTGTSSLEEAFEMMENGWEEGTNKLSELVTNATQHYSGHINQLEMNVAGYMPDVPRYLAGNPMCMYNRGTNFQPKKQYEIIVQCGYAAHTKENQIFNYGTAVLKVVDDLETYGNRVRVTMVEHSKSGGLTQLNEITIKDFQDPVDLNQLAFAICHRSFLRRVCFGLTESWTDRAFGSAYSSGYGIAEHVTPDMFIDGTQRILFKGLKDSAEDFDSIPTAIARIQRDLVSNGVTDLEINAA